MSQAPEVGRDVLPQGGLGAGQLDESDGGLVLIVVPTLYHWPRDAILSKAAGRQTARLSGDAGQLVIARGRRGLSWLVEVEVEPDLPQSVVNPLRLDQLLHCGAGGMGRVRQGVPGKTTSYLGADTVLQ